jgi:hypothetical protein
MKKHGNDDRWLDQGRAMSYRERTDCSKTASVPEDISVILLCCSKQSWYFTLEACWRGTDIGERFKGQIG